MLGPVLECGEIDGLPLRMGPANETQLATFVRWLSDPVITRYLGSNFSFSRAMEDKWFEGASTDPNRVHWSLTLGDTLIGTAGLEDINWITRTAVTGTMIGEREYWGKGIASRMMRRRAQYAFERLNLVAVYTEIFVGNLGSLGAARKAGYVEYGRKPFARYLDGEYMDAWEGVLTKEAWLASNPERW